MGVNLFQWGDFTLHSGQRSSYKIECDALTDADVECLSNLLLDRLPAFGSVEGVPRGGLPFAEYLKPHATTGPLLIIEDVWTTGGSMESQRAGRDAIGAVIFARNRPAFWVTALFEMTRPLH